jgi:hypothetical protein
MLYREVIILVFLCEDHKQPGQCGKEAKFADVIRFIQVQLVVLYSLFS